MKKFDFKIKWNVFEWILVILVFLIFILPSQYYKKRIEALKKRISKVYD